MTTARRILLTHTRTFTIARSTIKYFEWRGTRSKEKKRKTQFVDVYMEINFWNEPEISAQTDKMNVCCWLCWWNRHSHSTIDTPTTICSLNDTENFTPPRTHVCVCWLFSPHEHAAATFSFFLFNSLCVACDPGVTNRHRKHNFVCILA